MPEHGGPPFPGDGGNNRKGYSGGDRGGKIIEFTEADKKREEKFRLRREEHKRVMEEMKGKRGWLEPEGGWPSCISVLVGFWIVGGIIAAVWAFICFGSGSCSF